MTTMARVPSVSAPHRRTRNTTSWSTSRALQLDMSWCLQHLVSLQHSIDACDLPAIRTHATALRSVLIQHMVWDGELAEKLGNTVGIDHGATVRRWQGTILRSLFTINMLVESPSLEYPAVRAMLRRAVDGLDALLECYAEEIGATLHRTIDRRLPRLSPARVSALEREWRKLMASGYVA